MTDAAIARLTRQTVFSESQIRNYLARVAGDDDQMAECIREADQFGIDIDLLGR